MLNEIKSEEYSSVISKPLWEHGRVMLSQIICISVNPGGKDQNRCVCAVCFLDPREVALKKTAIHRLYNLIYATFSQITASGFYKAKQKQAGMHENTKCRCGTITVFDCMQ